MNLTFLGAKQNRKQVPDIIHIAHNGKYALSLGICNMDRKK